MTFPLNLVAYINGVRFAPASASITSAAGDAAGFTVSVPAVPDWDILPERSHCALFYSDPVTNSWRMLIEGEYIGYSRAKAATGARMRTLLFRALHGVWDSITYASMCSLATGDLDQVQQLTANGSTVLGTAAHDPASVQPLLAMIETMTSDNTRLSRFFPQLLQLAANQAPVDSFYVNVRKLADKMFTLEDAEIGGVIDVKLMQVIAQSGFNQSKLEFNSFLSTIVRAYESLGMYQHVPVINPPHYTGPTGTTTIAELLFTPYLYSCVPPACNVIFRDQITDFGAQRLFTSEPTRIVARLSVPAAQGQSSVSLYHMANSVERDIDVQRELSDQGLQGSDSAAAMVSHDLLSVEEHYRGVQPRLVDVPFENIGTNPSQLSIDKYMEFATRHQYEVQRGAVRTTSLTCTFLPYLQVGFPCLIEDKSGCLWGIVQRLTHSLSCDGKPSTSVVISHMREVYSVRGRFRAAPVPLWLNKAFRPNTIDSTYTTLFGVNAVDRIGGLLANKPYAAMVPDSVIRQAAERVSHTSLDADTQVDLDLLASYVVDSPVYDEKFQPDPSRNGSGQRPIADQLRATPDPAGAAYRFQYRSGTSLVDFCLFHRLPGVPTDDAEARRDVDYVFSGKPLPDDLCAGTADAHELFGAPGKLNFSSTTQGQYGPYDLAAGPDGTKISPLRQNIARAIQAAIARGIRED